MSVILNESPTALVNIYTTNSVTSVATVLHVIVFTNDRIFVSFIILEQIFSYLVYISCAHSDQYIAPFEILLQMCDNRVKTAEIETPFTDARRQVARMDRAVAYLARGINIRKNDEVSILKTFCEIL